jgi:hypothetical protein
VLKGYNPKPWSEMLFLADDAFSDGKQMILSTGLTHRIVSGRRGDGSCFRQFGFRKGDFGAG